MLLMCAAAAAQLAVHMHISRCRLLQYTYTEAIAGKERLMLIHYVVFRCHDRVGLHGRCCPET